MSGKYIFTALLLLFLLFGCRENRDKPENPYARYDQLVEMNRSLRSIDQGVVGTVTWWTGDFMPSTDSTPPSGNIDPYSDSVFVFDPITVSDTAHYDGFGGSIWNVTAPVIARTKSSSTGFFEVSLPPGDYSIFFHLSGDTLFGGMGAGDGTLMKVTVTAGHVTEFNYGITLEAYF